jgi:rhodanese-related sulfurtransferase
VNRITCADVNGLVNEGAILIDVRTSEEYNTDHIENAINVNSETIKYTIKKYVDDYNTPVIVYCQSGRRSAKSADILVNLGYTKVYDMGGITGCYGEE